MNSQVQFWYYQKKSTEVRQFEVMTFFIGKRKDRVRGLYMSINSKNRQELVSGINSMTVLYGIGDKYLEAREVKSWDDVSSVSIELELDSLFLTKEKKKLYVQLRGRG